MGADITIDGARSGGTQSPAVPSSAGAPRARRAAPITLNALHCGRLQNTGGIAESGVWPKHWLHIAPGSMGVSPLQADRPMLDHEHIQGWVSGLYPVLAPAPVTETLYERMGRVLGTRIEDETDIAMLMQAGVPAAAYKRAVDEIRIPTGYVLSAARARLAIAASLRLEVEDSDRLLRLVRLYAQACLMLGDEAAAMSWLHTPLRWRAGVVRLSPLELALRDCGARLAEQMLQRTVHGVH